MTALHHAGEGDEPICRIYLSSVALVRHVKFFPRAYFLFFLVVKENFFAYNVSPWFTRTSNDNADGCDTSQQVVGYISPVCFGLLRQKDHILPTVCNENVRTDHARPF